VLRQRSWRNSVQRQKSRASSATAFTRFRNGRSVPTEALAYNALVQSWPEITRLAREGGAPKAPGTGRYVRSE